MTDLEKALEWWESTPQFNIQISRLADAARRFANLTTPETIERATEAIRQTYAELGPSRCTSEVLAKAVLRAVEE